MEILKLLQPHKLGQMWSVVGKQVAGNGIERRLMQSVTSQRFSVYT